MRKWMLIAALLLGGCAQELSNQVPADKAMDTIDSASSDDALDLPQGMHDAEVSYESVAADHAATWTYRFGEQEIGKIIATVTPAGDAASKVSINFVDSGAQLSGRASVLRNLVSSDMVLMVKEALAARFENRDVDAGVKRQVAMDVAQASIGSVMTQIPQMQQQAMQAAADMQRDERNYQSEEHDRQQQKLVNPNGYGQAPDQHRGY